MSDYYVYTQKQVSLVISNESLNPELPTRGIPAPQIITPNNNKYLLLGTLAVSTIIVWRNKNVRSS